LGKKLAIFDYDTKAVNLKIQGKKSPKNEPETSGILQIILREKKDEKRTKHLRPYWAKAHYGADANR